MFSNVGWGEMGVLLLVGLFIFGPDRLPTLARDAGQMLRKIRATLTGVTDDLKAELGPEVADLDLRSLHPKAFMQKHLFDDDEPVAARPGSAAAAHAAAEPVGGGEPARPAALAAGERPPFDADAT